MKEYKKNIKKYKKNIGGYKKKLLLQLGLEPRTTASLMTQLLPYKYCALTNCATGAMKTARQMIYNNWIAIYSIKTRSSQPYMGWWSIAVDDDHIQPHKDNTRTPKNDTNNK